MNGAADIRIGAQVRVLRERADLTRQDLAIRLKIDVETLRRVETGVARAGLDLVNRLAATFGVPVWSFFVVFAEPSAPDHPPSQVH